ncbi:MAG: hypothetical protein ACK4GL_07865 [Flavobacteriales bacterium]
MNQNLTLFLLYAHTISGHIALLAGLFSLISKKGQRLHKKSGFIFFIGMLTVGISGVILSIAKSNLFLFHIAIFVGYQAFAGFRALKNKSLKAQWYDYLNTTIALVNGIFMVMSLQVILMVFGGIGLLLSIGELQTSFRIYAGQTLPKNVWLRKHIGMMIGAYIGASTAFLVVNFVLDSVPAFLIWLAPTVIFMPIMIYWQRKINTQNNLHDLN